MCGKDNCPSPFPSDIDCCKLGKFCGYNQITNVKLIYFWKKINSLIWTFLKMKRIGRLQSYSIPGLVMDHNHNLGWIPFPHIKHHSWLENQEAHFGHTLGIFYKFLLNIRFSDNDLQKITIVLSLKILDFNKTLTFFMCNEVDQLKTCCSINSWYSLEIIFLERLSQMLLSSWPWKLKQNFFGSTFFTVFFVYVLLWKWTPLSLGCT